MELAGALSNHSISTTSVTKLVEDLHLLCYGVDVLDAVLLCVRIAGFVAGHVLVILTCQLPTV